MTTRCLQCNVRYRPAKSKNNPARNCIRCQPMQSGHRTDIERAWLYLHENGPLTAADISFATGILHNRATSIVSRHPWFQEIGEIVVSGYKVKLYEVV